ncbi:hypothetical protein F4820DRAFT_448627 [Hypoxylon rubiginosum]|uniref:Uncharacterized protein n=1 Tax=Hypoxylon rubiginosum TaxID=110542 RepID=A0ACB9YZR5_9PEZI|nr:hypothetical protein F4820DRAFT_448627 [Hypoxylon rubiginosum]
MATKSTLSAPASQPVSDFLAKWNAHYKVEKHMEGLPASFHHLSREIRHMIYKRVIPNGHIFKSLKPPVLARVSKVIREEVIAYYFSQNGFSLSYEYLRLYNGEHDSYYGEFEEMGEILQKYLSFITNLTIQSKEIAFNVESIHWPGFSRAIDYYYKLVLRPNSALQNVKNDLTWQDNDCGVAGEAIIVQDGLDWDSIDDVYGAFKSAVDKAYGSQSYMSADRTAKEDTLMIGFAFAEIGQWRREGYSFVFEHRTTWEPTDHELDLRWEEEKRTQRRLEGRDSDVDTEDWVEEVRANRRREGRDPDMDTEDWEEEKRANRRLEGRDSDVDTDDLEFEEEEEEEGEN